MVIGIIGSIQCNNYDEVSELLSIVNKKTVMDKIVCGGKSGVERLAEKYANIHKIPIEVCYPNWSEFGTTTFHDNINRVIEKSDLIYCFYNDDEKEQTEILDRINKQKKKYRLLSYKK